MNNANEEFAALIAIDWGDKKHAFCFYDVVSGKSQAGNLSHTPETIDDWVSSLRKRYQGKTIAIALEQSKGGLIYALMKYDFLVLFPVHPATLAKYRAAWNPSGAKDDPSDAALLLDLLRKHPERLKPWKPDSEQTRMLQRLTELRRKLMDDRKRIGNRLTNLLKDYFPLVLLLFPDIGTKIICEFILQFPTLEILKNATEDELKVFFRKYSPAHPKKNIERIAAIKEAKPLTTDNAIITPSALMAQTLARQIRALILDITTFDKQIAALYQQHPDSFIFDSLPGVGEVYGPRLLVALGSDRTRFSSADELSRFSGVAPVLARSGNHTWIHWRLFCNKILRQAFLEWAGRSILDSFWAKSYYRSLKQKGKSHHVAIRALAYKWIRIIFRLWQDRKTYNESLYLEALRKSHSPLLATIANSN